MYLLLSSTRYDTSLNTFEWNNDHEGPSPFFLLSCHLERLSNAAEQHGWKESKASLSYESLKQKCLHAVKSYESPEKFAAFKIRITLSESGDLNVSASPVAPFHSDPFSISSINPTSNTDLKEPIMTVYIDTQPTPSSVFTNTKTTERSMYDAARSRAKIDSPTSEVILYNTDSLVTEATIFNVAFFRSSHWVTPSSSTGCLPGVIRRWLLERGRVQEDHEKQLTKASIQEGEWVLLFNGVQGCRLGKISFR